jgi:hypothetical protein
MEPEKCLEFEAFCYSFPLISLYMLSNFMDDFPCRHLYLFFQVTLHFIFLCLICIQKILKYNPMICQFNPVLITCVPSGVPQALMLLSCIRKVLGSNAGRDTGFLILPSPPREMLRKYILSPRPLPSTLFLIYHSIIHPTSGRS